MRPPQQGLGLMAATKQAHHLIRTQGPAFKNIRKEAPQIDYANKVKDHVASVVIDTRSLPPCMTVNNDLKNLDGR
jgi:hypothetical protein